MADTNVITSLKSAFRMEIANEFSFKENEIVVVLADGTKARITAKRLD